MKLGFIGLGKMGARMVCRLLERGHTVVVYDRSRNAVVSAAEQGAEPADSLEQLVLALPAPRLIWMMVPAGEPVDAVLSSLLGYLKQDDIVVDGGNSRFSDSVRRASMLLDRGILFLDVGTSGGLEGAQHGACMMVGGDAGAYALIRPLLNDLCVQGGYAHMGRSGAGHYVKMVHNAIEYGMMQALGEGFELLESSGFDLDHEQVARVWVNGSVIRGWLMELVADAFAKDGRLGYLTGEIADSGEGRWTVACALEQEVSIPVIAASLFRRFHSRNQESFSDKVVAALRHEFGGHFYTPKR